MTDKHVKSEAPQSNMEKDPSDWVTGDEPMTGAQKSYLKTLSEEAKVDFDESLTKAEASEHIDALQKETGRGAHGSTSSGGGESKAHGHAAKPSHARDDAPPAAEDEQAEPDEGDLFAAQAEQR